MKMNFNPNEAMPECYNESYVRLTQVRQLYFYEDFSKKSCMDLVANLLALDNASNELITLFIHSSGGDSSGLTSVYDAMQMCKSKIATVCLGKCYSAAAVILAAGSKGYRYALRSSKIMIHGVQFGFPLPGEDILSSKNYYKFVKDHNDDIMKILSKHTGNPLENLLTDCSSDFWMDPFTAKNYGIIDYIGMPKINSLNIKKAIETIAQ